MMAHTLASHVMAAHHMIASDLTRDIATLSEEQRSHMFGT